MKFFKKAFLLSLVLIALVVTLASCSKKKVTLSAEKSEISVIIGENVDLKLSATEVKKYSEQDILGNLDITSSDNKIVKVEADKITAVGIGTANVTATWKEYDGATVTVKVNVIAPEVGEVTYSNLPANIYIGDKFQITHTAGSDVTVTYDTSNKDVLSVDGNNFEALAKGTAKITATATNGYKETKKEWNVEVLQGEYTITYVLNGGVNSEANPSKYDIRELPLVINPATHNHKIFLGWTTEENSTNYITEIVAGATGDITLYAQFADIVHNITYELAGGVLPEDAPTTYVEGVCCVLPVPTCDGYTFLGWTTEETSTIYITEIGPDSKGEFKVYAQWEKILVYSNIVYELNGGENPKDAPKEYLEGIGCVLPVPTKEGYLFLGWLYNGELVNEIPVTARGDLNLVASFTELEGAMFKIEFVTNQENVIWPSRDAVSREEIVVELFKDLYEWAKGNGETRSYADYETYIKGKIAAYENIKLRNTSLGNYPAEDGSTEYFLNVPKYYQKWKDFFAIFHEAMLKVNSDQSFYTDTYATMVRLNQFVTWTSTGQKYFESYLSKMYKATMIPQEIPTSYCWGETLALPSISLPNGLAFLGWYDNPEFNGSPISNITSTDAGNKVFYAKWANEVKVEKFEINQISELLLFTTHQLVWTLTPDNATEKTVEFFSSNEAVATVSAKGLITALANGKTTITVRVYGNRKLDVVFELTVFTNEYIDGSFETDSYVVIDESIKLNADVVRKDGTTSSVVWKSLTPDIATVDTNGLVTALNAGIAKIVAQDPNNASLKLEFAVVVLEELPEDILGLAIESNESNIFTRYDLNIGNTYNKDILGSVSKLLGNSPLVKNNKYYEASNKSAATYGTMSSIEFITVHYTGNMAAGADANANASYFSNNGSTSIHYTTGNDGVFYCMDETKGAWHAGDSGALAEVGEFKWIKSGVKVGANDPMYPNITISNDFYYEINGQKTTVKMPTPWNYNNRNTDHILNANGTISSKSSYSSTGFTNRTPESFINEQGLPFTIIDGEYYMGTTWWAYTQVYEGRICSTGGNRNSIGIESCVNEGSDLWWTWQKTAQLVADIMVRHNLDITRVRGHHFYTAKDCPQPMLENDQEIWYEFLELVEAEYELLTKYAGYEVTITSNNPDIVDNYGRVIKQPTETTCVTYTITFTKGNETKSITLSSMVKGLYVDR